MGAGVRQLDLDEIAPHCEIDNDSPLFTFEHLKPGESVLDIGCGSGKTRNLVSKQGAVWVGLERFSGGNPTVLADAETLPFSSRSFDVVVMDSVLEHIPNPVAAFAEVGRVLKPHGLLVGYVAWMECFHEISYCHLSWKALEHFSSISDMKLEKLSGGERFGIDYHLAVIFHPLPLERLRPIIAFCVRAIFRMKALAYFFRSYYRYPVSGKDAYRKALRYYQLEQLRQSHGFSFVIRKTADSV